MSCIFPKPPEVFPGPLAVNAFPTNFLGGGGRFTDDVTGLVYVMGISNGIIYLEAV